ncbi:uncharacterized protein N7477_009681 [Penicillium maclennaniae]|uniref:uncharacterized protein n=1 Tax=Penicillium maclennaniae TaxID=1343394 RepID=UPI002541094D|nr:uncharacterized protein N7477_009681 [Penicillium maclennaniae]KAJ5662065.1 hypothetical protein N7477_009681 [Penicillium maclennaniae]
MNAIAFDPLSALNSTHGLSFIFNTSFGVIDESYVDRLELRAAKRALLNLQSNGTPTPVPDPSGSVAAEALDQELNTARIGALSLRIQLYGQDGQALNNLLKKETANATQFLTACANNSNGTFRDGHVKIIVSGKLTSAMIMPFLAPLLSGAGIAAPSPTIQEIIEGFFFPSHPEHYQLYLGSITGITETIGGIPTRFYLDVLPQPPDFVMQYRDLSYTVGIAGRGHLDNGKNTTISWTLQQFKQANDGIDISLRVWYPIACPDNYVHDHLEHLCIEYRNALHLIAALLGIN